MSRLKIYIIAFFIMIVIVILGLYFEGIFDELFTSDPTTMVPTTFVPMMNTAVATTMTYMPSHTPLQTSSHTIICGCAKDCEIYLDNVFKNIKKIQNILDVKQIVIAYDKSNDKTLLKLCELKTEFNIEILINKDPLTSERTQNICNARNKLLDYINKLDYHIDYFIMIDLDDVCSQPINIDVLEGVLDDVDKWDAITFNNERYYDFWALSIGDFQYSCWHWDDPRKVIKLMHSYFQSQIESKNGNYIECDSAFNGFGLYKYDVFKNCLYKSIIEYPEIFSTYDFKNISVKYNIKPIFKNMIYDCEHRFFHLNAKNKNNAKIVICKKNLFPSYTGEHARFLYV